MFDELRTFALAPLAAALQDRLVLLANHVVSSEPAVAQRLSAHAGRRLQAQLQGLPPWLPGLPPLRLRLTPAGLFEADADTAAPDLLVSLPWRAPHDALSAMAMGRRPDVQVEGDAALAAELQWLLHNLRWDIEADLERVLGPVAARNLAQAGARAGAAVQSAAAGIGQVFERLRNRP